MSNIIWSASEGWHDGPAAVVSAERGRIAAKITAGRVHLVQMDSTGMWRGRDDDETRVGYWATRSDAVEELTGLGYVLVLQNAIGSTWELGPQYRGI